MTTDKNLISGGRDLVNKGIDSLMQLDSDRKMKLTISKSKGNRIIIKVLNNGSIIPIELQEKIFIPFFTTKENGSGIGLSLSRQIMKQNKGSISVISNPDDETVFTLEL